MGRKNISIYSVLSQSPSIHKETDSQSITLPTRITAVEHAVI